MQKILIVEDNPVNSRMLSQWLSRFSYNLGVVENGEDAVSSTYHYLPDLVLMDMSLPLKDGWTATKELRTWDRTAEIPIIALTAHAMESDRERAIECGCNAFVAKPIDFKLLKSTMTELIGQPTRAVAS